MAFPYARRMSLVALGLILLAAVGWSSASAKRDAGDIKVGVLIQLSGAAGVFGPPSQQAAQLAVDQINAGGGLLGKKVKLVIADDATDVKVAGEQALRLMNKDKVSVLISTESSAARDAVLPVVKRAGGLMIYTPLYEGGACDKHLFDLGEVPQQQVAPVIPYLQRTYGGKKWFIVGDDYVWPRSLGKATHAIVSKSAGSVVGEEYVPLGTSDFGTTMGKIKKSGATNVLMTLVGSDAIAFVKQVNDFGLGGKLKVFGLALLDNVLPAIGPNTKGLYASFGYFGGLNTPGNRVFLRQLRAKYARKTAQQTTLSEGTYDGIRLWALAVKKAGSTDPEAVAKAMGGISFNAPKGRITVDAKTHHVAQHIYLGVVQPNHKYRIVKDFGLIQPGRQCSF
jgi:urea transport system substrate-binding protein